VQDAVSGWALEVVSKPSIGFKAKAEFAVQPQEYNAYFED
jgi:hypothetical protein